MSANLTHKPFYNKPSIVEVIGRRLELRKAGKEYKGLCPFHSERNPSFTVNEDKGLFYCFGCGAFGDVFDFIQKLDGLSFREALAALGMSTFHAVRPAKNDRVKQTAAQISAWANTQTDRANYLLREIGQRLQLAKDIGWTEEADICSREWEILSDLAEDLQQVKLVIELYKNRAQIEALLVDADLNQPEDFPPLTEEYRAMVKSYLVEVVDG
jgi:hypothetical protein